MHGLIVTNQQRTNVKDTYKACTYKGFSFIHDKNL